jgi:enoyl-CoA hydratase
MSSFETSRQGDVVVVRLQSGPGNPLDPATLAEGADLAEELRGEAPGAVVLTGDDRFFSAGMDLRMLAQVDRDTERAIVAGLNRMYAAWYGFPRPVVSAVGGHAVAGGLVLALCGDYRIGSTRARYGLSEVRVDLRFPAVPLAVGKQELSAQAARLLMLSGELVDANEAFRLGVIDELVEPADVLDRGVAVAQKLATVPRGAFEATKADLRGDLVAEMARRVAAEDDPLLDGWFGPETARAAIAILEAPRGA